MIIAVWKYIGETPLQALRRASAMYSQLQGDEITTVCYTNRLDPMAQGIITILFGEDVNRAAEFNARDKVYQFQAILGVSTDSYDPLGHILGAESTDKVKDFINAMLSLRDINQEFPPCSGYIYKGKPLWRHHKEGTLPNPMPSKPRTVYAIELVQQPTELPLSSYIQECFSDMNDIDGGDFDIPAIKKGWRALEDIQLHRIVFKAHVSSGTFIRSLVNDTAKSLGLHAHAFRITRLES
jgi:tRNA pseudouridine55 synthase